MATFKLVDDSRPMPLPDKSAVERGEMTLKQFRRAREAVEARASPAHQNRIRLHKVIIATAAFVWIVGGGLGMLLGYLAHRRGYFTRKAAHPKLSDMPGFVGMLAAACENAGMQGTLERLLSLPDAQRRELLGKVIHQMREGRAPKDIVDAFVCLQDDAIAEKAYEVVFKCPRGVPIEPLQAAGTTF